MAVPVLSPISTTNAVVLTATGSTISTDNGAANLEHYPLGLYADATSPIYDANFISGAADQVAYTYKKLGGDVLDIEITPGNVYAAYEEAVFEYSYQINSAPIKKRRYQITWEQSTGTFDQDGQLKTATLSGTNVNLRYPRFRLGYAKKVATWAWPAEAGVSWR
jgi:hypothetical protein